MHIELFGCTGAGKSTLVDEIERVCRDLDIRFQTGDDVALRQVRLEKLRPRFLRTLFVDVVTLSICAWSYSRYRPFHRLAFHHTMSLPVPLFQKINLLRNVLKKIGIFELVSAEPDEGGIVIVDEGTLHAAHNLFVHVSAEPPKWCSGEFMSVVPLPQLAVYATLREPVLVKRTLERGHRRLPDATREDVVRFIRQAVRTLDAVAASDELAGRLVRVDLDQLHVSTSESTNGAPVERVEEILVAALGRLEERR